MESAVNQSTSAGPVTSQVMTSQVMTSQACCLMDDRLVYYGRQTQLYFSPLLILVGTVGNLVALAVLVTRCLRATPMHNFLVVLAVADTAVLWLGSLKAWIKLLTGYDPMHQSDAACQTINFLKLCAGYTASWTIVAMTVERFLAVQFPLRVDPVRAIRRARLACGGLLVLALGANLHVFWTFGLTQGRERMYCTIHQSNTSMLYSFETVKLTVYCFIPFLLVSTLNLLIVAQIRASPSLLRQDTERISVLLLTVSLAWVLLTLPHSLSTIVPAIRHNYLLRVVCFQLMYLNHSINLFLYCFPGGRFKAQLLAMVTGCWRGPGVHSVPV